MMKRSLSNKIIIDIETYSDCDLSKSGPWKYSKDPSTGIRCLVAWHDGVYVSWKPGEKAIEFPEYEFVAHNFFFEWCIFENVLPKYGFKKIPYEHFFCTIGLSTSLGLPFKLEQVCEVLKLNAKKDKDGRRLMLKMCKTSWKYNSEEEQRLVDYCLADVMAEKELYEKLIPYWVENEKNIFDLNTKINLHGIPVETPLVHKALKFLENYNDELKKEFEAITKLNSPRQGKALLMFLNAQGLDITNLQKDTVQKELLNDIKDETVKRALEIRQCLSGSSSSKLNAMEKMEDEGRIYGTHVYHAATTGRFSSKGVQFQNIPRGKVSDILFNHLEEDDYDLFSFVHPDVNKTLISMLRGFVKGAGSLLVGDYASIETRVLMWASGAENGLEAVNKGRDLYKIMAAKVFNKKEEEINTEERQLGKVIILACGYGMGAPKFKTTCKAWGMDITDAFAETAIKAYRNLYASVPEFWRSCQNAAINAIQDKRQYKNIKNGIRFITNSEFLFIILPSGRKLAYYKPFLKDGDYGKEICFEGLNSMSHKWEIQKTYGGKLVENIIQALARDLLCHSMKKLDEKGFKIIMHVHDEIVCEEKDGSRLKEFETIMKEKPEWAQNIPVDVEAHAFKRYTK